MDNRDYRNYSEEKNKRFKGTFYIVISVITLIVAIIGASFSYFIATASSDENAITTGSTGFSLDFQQYDQNLVNTDLIPSASNVALYSAIRQPYDSVKLQAYLNEPSVENKRDLAGTKCRDDNGNAICSTYRFTVTNPAEMGVKQTLKFKLAPSVNEFANLYMMVVRVDSIIVDNPTTKEEAGVVVDEFHLTSSTLQDDGWILEDMTYTLDSGSFVTYEIILYIKNLEDEVVEDTVISSGDQTEADSNKSFAAGIIVYPEGGDGSNQIYGVIGLASDTFTE